MNCQICFENNGEPCYCGFCSCMPCMEKWIVSDNRDPSCPNCKRVWSQDYIYSNCSSSFLKNEYRIWRQTYLAVREKIYLADDFETVRLEKKRRNLRKELLSLYRKKKTHLRKKLDIQEIADRIANIKAEMPPSHRGCGQREFSFHFLLFVLRSS